MCASCRTKFSAYGTSPNEPAGRRSAGCDLYHAPRHGVRICAFPQASDDRWQAEESQQSTVPAASLATHDCRMLAGWALRATERGPIRLPSAIVVHAHSPSTRYAATIRPPLSEIQMRQL